MKGVAAFFLSLWLFQIAPPLSWTPGESSRTIGEKETLAEARRNAENEARRKAIAGANGTELTAKTIVENSQLALDLVTAYEEGLIVREEMIESRPEVIESGGKYFINWNVRLRAQVTAPRKVRHDPGFQAVIDLEKSVFTEGENLALTVKPTRDSYIHIFNVGADGAVTALVPNRYHRDKFVRAGAAFRFPSAEEERQGIRLTATLPQDASSSEEKITVIATRRDIDLVGTDFQEAVFKVYDGKTTGLITQLNEKLSALADADWVQDVTAYRIFKKK